MIAKISTILDTTPEKMWGLLKHPDSLIFVCKPILYLSPKEGTSFSSDWKTDKEYKMNLFLFKVIPLGSHNLVIKSINKISNELISNEFGFLTKRWNHTIKFSSINSKQVEYSDTIKINAGIFTIFIWIFAQIFYRHRQRRWRKLLLKYDK